MNGIFNNGVVISHTHKRHKVIFKNTLSVMALASVFCGPQAWAQDSDAAGADPKDTIIVTGSRIPRPEFESLQPVTVLSSETLELRGAINIGDALNEQAGFGLPGTSPVGAQAASSLGQNFANFLGLGAQRTLTLVNGQRFPAGAAPNGDGGLSIDLNAIPAALIDRVETIAIGGAPIYGADAIAGTVNIILKDDFEGIDIVSSFGISPEFGDAERYRAGVTWGANFDDDRGNIVLAGEFSRTKGLLQTDRPVTADGLGFFGSSDPNSPFARVLIIDPTVAVDDFNGGPLFSGNQFGFNIFGNGIPLDPTDPNSPLSSFDDDGNLIPFIPGGGTSSPIFQQGGDGLDLNELTALYTDLDRYNTNIFLTYDVTPSIRFKAEGWFARTHATELVNQPDFNSPAFGGLPNDTFGNVGEGPVPVLLDNPFLPQATRDTIALAIDFDNDGFPDPTIDTDLDGIADTPGFYTFGGLIDLVGANRNNSQRTTYRAVLGFDGDVEFADRNFNWDVVYTYGRNVSIDSSTEIVQSLFDQAVQVVDDGNGNAVCADPSGGCVPVNIVGTSSQAAADFVTEIVDDKVTIQQHVISANAGGDIFTLPAGPVGAAVGFTYRVEKAAYDPSELGVNGFLRDPRTPISGSFNSTEFYGEALVPVLGGELNTPLVESLEFEGAIRYVDNSIAGTDLTWTLGGRYQPISDIQFRGNVTKSIRAPSITELFTPESRINTFANDPCDSRFIGQGNFPNRRAANCAADGIPLGFQSFIVNASQPGTLSGNQNLVSERANSWTVGVILRPRFIEGLSASVDWLDIDIVDAIETLNATDLLQACYDSAAFPNEPACSTFTRDPAGQVSSIQTGFVNVGLLEYTGLLSTVSYDFGLGDWGDMHLNVNHIYSNDHIETPGAANPNRQDGEIGRSKHRINATATLSKGDWTLFNQVRWYNGAVFDNADGPLSRDILGVGDWLVVDTSLGYRISDNAAIQLNVDNLFNAKPPFPAVAGGGNAIQTYFSGILERYVTLTFRGSF